MTDFTNTNTAGQEVFFTIELQADGSALIRRTLFKRQGLVEWYVEPAEWALVVAAMTDLGF